MTFILFSSLQDIEKAIRITEIRSTTT